MSDEKKNQRQLEVQLEAKTADIKHRLLSIQEEAQTLGESVKDSLLKHPYVGVGGVLAAGLMVGLLFGGRNKRRLNKQQALVEAYVAALATRAQRKVQKGEQPEEAIREVLENRFPMLVVDREEASGEGIVRQTLSLLVRSALGILISILVDRYLNEWMEAKLQAQEQVAQAQEQGADRAV